MDILLQKQILFVILHDHGKKTALVNLTLNWVMNFGLILATYHYKIHCKNSKKNSLKRDI